VFVQVFDTNTKQRLGKVGLSRNTGILTDRQEFSIGTHLGAAGLRSSYSRRDANGTRELFRLVQQFVGATGYAVKVETNQREANALMAGGFVQSNGGTYRLQVSEDRQRVVTLYGHGKVG